MVTRDGHDGEEDPNPHDHGQGEQRKISETRSLANILMQAMRAFYLLCCPYI